MSQVLLMSRWDLEEYTALAGAAVSITVFGFLNPITGYSLCFWRAGAADEQVGLGGIYSLGRRRQRQQRPAILPQPPGHDAPGMQLHEATEPLIYMVLSKSVRCGNEEPPVSRFIRATSKLRHLVSQRELW